MTGSYVKSTLALGLEPSNAQGRQLLFGPTVIGATQSLANQPIVTSTQGVHLLIEVRGLSNGAAATIGIAGKKIDGTTSVSESTTNISTTTADSNGLYYYATTAIFGSVDASGITANVTSNALTNAVLTIYGYMAPKANWMIPCEFKPDTEYDVFSPDDNRGLYDEDVRMTQLIKKVTWDLSASLYPETDEWFLLSGIANATSPATPASIPGSPTTLKAATAFSTLNAGSFGVTTAPSYPGMMLVFVVAGGNLVAGTISITGQDRFGNTISEVVSIPGSNGTFYSLYGYNTLSGTAFTTTGFTGAATLAISGVYAFNKIYTPSDSLYTLCGEHFDGVASNIISQMLVQEWSVEHEVKSALKFSAKGAAQDYLAVGDQTTASVSSSRFQTYVQSQDYPVASWPGVFYIDALGGTPATTNAFGTFDIMSLKIMGTTGLVPYWIATGGQTYLRFGRKKRKTTWEAEIDFINLIAYRQYESFTKGLFVAQFREGRYIGNNAGALVYKQLQFTMPSRRVKFTREGGDEKVIGKVSGTCEYTDSLGYSFQAQLVNQNPPSYATP